MNQFLERYKELGEEFDPAKVSLKPVLRINTLKSSFDELSKTKKAYLKKISFLEEGYEYKSKFSLASTIEYLQGYFYLQESASQLCSEVLDPKPEDLVLDMCASPGSKTTHMAMLMKNKGIIVALDVNNARLPKLQNNLERCEVKNTIIYKKDSRFADDLGLKFDKVLLDAPCSGNFVADDTWFDNRNLPDFKLMAKTQKQLIETAVEVLKPKGTLVYSTCSLEPEENEEVIDWLLKKRNDIELEEIKQSIGDPGLTKVFSKELNKEVVKCKRFWPHKTATQPFFIAKIRKK